MAIIRIVLFLCVATFIYALGSNAPFYIIEYKIMLSHPSHELSLSPAEFKNKYTVSYENKYAIIDTVQIDKFENMISKTNIPIKSCVCYVDIVIKEGGEKPSWLHVVD